MSQTQKQLVFVLLGPQGAGKGTQAEYLTDHFHIPAVSLGQMLREEITAGTELGVKAKPFIENGKFVPEEIVSKMLTEVLKKPEYASGIILDGFPRTITQAEELAKLTKVSALIAIEISDAEAVDRLSHRLTCSKCGRTYNELTRPPVQPNQCDKDGAELMKRKDDAPDAIRERLKAYHAETKPLIDYYAKQGIVARVQGEQPIVEVHEDIVQALKDCCKIEKPKA